MIKNKDKEKIQKEILSTLLTDKDLLSGSIYAGTGVGKTYISIMYIKEFKKRYGFYPKVAFVVPTTQLRDVDMPDEFIKWKARTYMKKVDFICYASLHKIENKNYDIVILDEGHHFTELSASFLQNNKWKFVLAMTATEPRDLEKRELLEIFAPKRAEYSIEDGVEDGIVKDFILYVVYVDLDDKERYIEVTPKDKQPFKTTEYKQYQYYDKVCDKFKFAYFNALPKNKKGLEFVWKKNLSIRARIIYNSLSKLQIANTLLDLVIPKQEKTLIFCKSIKQAEKLCNYTYHSKTDDQDLLRFNKGEITRLACVDALNEGKNINDLHTAVIVQLDSNPKNLVQRIGRTLRLKAGEIAQIYIIVARNTQDEIWLEKALEGFDNPKINYIDSKQLSSTLSNLFLK